MAQRFQFDVEGEQVTALVYAATKPLGFTLLLGPGATAGQRDGFVVNYATALARRGVLVVTYDFPFVEHGRRSPDRTEVLEACCRAAVVAARECRPKNRLFIGGKSLGGRIASEVAAEGGDEIDDLAGLVLLGYPLHAVGKPETPRWGHLRDVQVPTLIVQGTRDVFGTPGELRPALTALPKGSLIHTVEGGDHSFTVSTRGKQTQEQSDAAIQDAITRWMSVVAAMGSGRPAAAAKRRPIASRIGTQLRALRRGGATRPESLRAEATRKKKTRAEKLGTPHESKRAGKKASYAREAQSNAGRPSRKSSRASANRAKPDTNLILREGREQTSPQTRFRKARARASRVRGSGASS